MGLVFTPFSDHAKTVHSIGDMYLLVGSFTFSASYSTGGETLSPTLESLFKQIGVGEVLAILKDSARGHSLEYDATAGKVKIYSSANTEHAAAAYNAALTASPVAAVILGR